MSVLPAIIREPEERHDDDAVLQQKGARVRAGPRILAQRYRRKKSRRSQLG